MSVVTIRDVPEDDLEVIKQRAREEHKSFAAYVRDMLASEAERARRLNQAREARALIKDAHRRFDVSHVTGADTAAAVRAVRDEYESGEAP